MARPTVSRADGRGLRRSSALAGVGEGVLATAVPLLAAGLTRDPLSVAGVVAAQQLPWAALAAWEPAPVSAADQRTVLGLAASLRAAAAAVIGILAMSGVETLPALLGAAAVVGLGEALADGAEQVAEPQLDGASGSGPVAVLRRDGMVGLAVVGMPLGGLVYELAAGLPFLFDMGVFALAGLAALSLRSRLTSVGPAGQTARAPGLGSLVPGTATVTTAACVTAAASGAVLGVLVLFALDDLGLGAPAFGLLLSGMAAAAAAGGWAAPAVGQRFGLRAGVAVALAASGTGYAAAGVLGDPANPLPAVAGLGLAAFGGMVANVLVRALVHATAGRVVDGAGLSAFHARVWAAVPAGALAGGLVAETTGVAGVLVAAGMVSGLAVLAVLSVASPSLAGAVRKMG